MLTMIVGIRRSTWPSPMDCSNWGVVGREFCRIGRLDLVYPAWRKNSEEDFVKGKLYHPTTISYELPALSDYDKVFICRSGAWTPPWFDDQFEEFVAGSCCEVTYLEAVEPRGVSLDQARVMRENMQKLMTNKMGVV